MNKSATPSAGPSGHARVIKAAQAALSASVIAFLTAYLIALVGHVQSGNVTLPVLAGTATMLVTFAVWYTAFPSSKTPRKRAYWVGPLIVFFSMWLMFVAFGLTLDETYLDSGGLPAAIGKSFFMGLFFAIFGSIYAGLLVYPLSIAATWFLRRHQE